MTNSLAFAGAKPVVASYLAIAALMAYCYLFSDDAEVGRLLKSVLVTTYHRKGVYNRVNAIRSELDE